LNSYEEECTFRLKWSFLSSSMAASEVGYRIDLLVEELVVVELKAITELLPIHQAQLLSYLKLSKKPVGLLINFHVEHLKDGIKRLTIQ